MSNLLPFLPNRVWRSYQGGAVLDQLEGRENPVDSHFPEDWIGSTTAAINPGERPADEGLARIDTPGAPVFSDLIRDNPVAMLGERHVNTHGAEPRLLVKLLDSAVRLHFQAHPTARFARSHGLGPSGKAEAYYILEVRPEVADPCVYLGFQNPPSVEAFKSMIERQDIDSIEACFERIPVRTGDCLFIPGGRPHAIGPGILMVEVMEPSDLAVRFEFHKGGYTLPPEARFMGRDLEFCLRIFDFSPIPLEEVRRRHFFEPQPIEGWEGGGLGMLIGPETTSCFRIRRSDYTLPVERTFEEPVFAICVQGGGRLTSGGDILDLRPYRRCFIPAGSQVRITPDGSQLPLQILECLPPEP